MSYWTEPGTWTGLAAGSEGCGEAFIPCPLRPDQVDVAAHGADHQLHARLAICGRRRRFELRVHPAAHRGDVQVGRHALGDADQHAARERPGAHAAVVSAADLDV